MKKRKQGKQEKNGGKTTEYLHVVCVVGNLIYQTHPHQYCCECTPGMIAALPSILMTLPPLKVLVYFSTSIRSIAFQSNHVC